MKRDVLVWSEGGVVNDVEIYTPTKAKIICDQWAKEKGFKDYNDFMNSEYDDDDELRWFGEIDVDGKQKHSGKLNPSKRVQECQ